jgi:preprotein translocase subunit SecA
LLGETLENYVKTMCDDLMPPSGIPGELLQIDFGKLERSILRRTNTVVRIDPAERKRADHTRLEFYEMVQAMLRQAYEAKEQLFGEQTMREIERWLLLQTLDSYWKDHLLSLDHLRDGIGLRGYGQKDPLQEYKREAFELFKRLTQAIRQDTLEGLFRVQPNLAEKLAQEVENDARARAERELGAARSKKEDGEGLLEGAAAEVEAEEEHKAQR